MTSFITNLVVVFLVKVLDNILGTSKTILVQKNKAFLASITAFFISKILLRGAFALSRGLRGRCPTVVGRMRCLHFIITPMASPVQVC